MRSKPHWWTDAQNIQAYKVTEVGERKAVVCPGDDVGVKTKLSLSCFELNLAEACPGIDAGGGECRAGACPGR